LKSTASMKTEELNNEKTSSFEIPCSLFNIRFFL